MSKTSETIASFHEMKFAVVARLFEGRSPEFRSHRRMNPWNSNRGRFCDVLSLLHCIINVQDGSVSRRLLQHVRLPGRPLPQADAAVRFPDEAGSRSAA